MTSTDYPQLLSAIKQRIRSASNLWRMKAFFEAYSSLEKLAPLVREIGWSHNLVR